MKSKTPKSRTNTQINHPPFSNKDSVSKQENNFISANKDILSSIFEYAPDAMIVVDQHGKIQHINGQVETIFGYESAELINRSIETLIPERFHINHKKHISNYGKTLDLRLMGKDFSLFGKRKDDSEFPVEIMLSPVRSGEENFVIAVVRDVTERKKSEDALQKSEKYRW